MPGIDSRYHQLCTLLLRFGMSLFIHSLCVVDGRAQRSVTSFGPMTDIVLDYTPLQLQLIHPLVFGRDEVVVLAAETPVIHSYRIDDTANLVGRATVHLLHAARTLTSADVNGDGVPEVITLSRDGEFVSIIDRTITPVRERVISVRAQRQELAIADINNDRRPDLLFFGKQSSGIATFLGSAGAGFSTGRPLFPEISISGLVTTDLNEDGIIDVLLLNWLSNQLAVFYGIGRGIFAEQVSVDLPGEPSHIAITPVTRERTVRVAVTIPEQRLIAVLDGSAAGEFGLREVISCDDVPVGVQFVSVNEDAHVDLVSSSRKGILVMLGGSGGTFGPPTVFGACDAPVSWAVGDIDGDRKADIAIADREGKRIVLLGNASHSGSMAWPAHYGVGNSPRGLTTGDMNGDGLEDIAIVNEVSSSLSVLFNKGDGKMNGQQVLQISERPMFVTTVASPLPSERTLVASHAGLDRLTVVKILDHVSDSPAFTISTGSNPYVIRAKMDSIQGALEFLVRYANPRDGMISLSLFEEIGKGKFLERSIRSDAPKKISGLTVNPPATNGEYVLSFCSNDKMTGKSTISIALSSSDFHFTSSTPLLSFSDSTASTHSLLSEFVDADSFKDLVVLLGQPRNAIGIIYGREDATYHDSVMWIEGVVPMNDDAIVFRDLDNDGEGDIVLIDAVGGEVLALYGMRDRTFGPPVPICSARDLGGVRVAPLRVPNRQDLVLTNQKKGMVTIMFNPFSR